MKVAVYRNKEKIMLQAIGEEDRQQDSIVSVSLQQGKSIIEVWELVEEYFPVNENNMEAKLHELISTIYKEEGILEREELIQDMVQTMLKHSVENKTQKN